MSGLPVIELVNSDWLDGCAYVVFGPQVKVGT
jgi:hypothetical protein